MIRFVKLFAVSDSVHMSSEILYHPANLGAILGVLCFGLAANSLSSVIWFKQVRAKSGSFFLCCLSVADALFCLTQGVMMGKLLTKQPSSCQDAILSLVIAVFANFSRLMISFTFKMKKNKKFRNIIMLAKFYRFLTFQNPNLKILYVS